MARSLERDETDLLLSIRRQILNFSGLSDGDTLHSLHLPDTEVYTDGLQVLKNKCEEELLQLEREVSQLEAEEAKASMSKAEKLKALNDAENILPPSEVDEHELEEDINQLENEIELLAKITGLRIDETSYKVTDIGDNFLRKHHRLDGSCHAIGFKIRFDVEETWEHTGEVTAKLSNIKLKAPDEDTDVLLPVLQRIGTYNSLTMMFRVLLAYAKWKSETEALLQDLTNTYSGVAEFQENLSLVIKPQRNPGCEWNFTFGCTFSNDCKLCETADLTIKLPRAMVAADDEGVYQSAPSKYKLMQTTLGITPATKALISTLLE